MGHMVCEGCGDPVTLYKGAKWDKESGTEHRCKGYDPAQHGLPPISNVLPPSAIIHLLHLVEYHIHGPVAKRDLMARLQFMRDNPIQ